VYQTYNDTIANCEKLIRQRLQKTVKHLNLENILCASSYPYNSIRQIF